MDTQLIKNTYYRFTNFNIGMPFCGMHITTIKNDLIKISQDIESTESFFSNELFRLKDMLFNNQNGFINHVHYGEIVAILKYLNDKCSNPQKGMWSNIHPQIERVSKQLFLDGHFANAAEDAFIEINSRVKHIFSKINPGQKIPDGESAMTHVFSINNPMLLICDISTVSGADTQRGFMLMLQGAMAALRNPKAHSNSVVITQDECERRLMFASMLMHKIDEAVAYSGILE